MEKRKEKLEYGKRGITLIALVVTIVVLLILAGITINLLFSNGGIFKVAGDAANAWNEATINEQESINNMTEQIQNLVNGQVGGSTETQLVTEIILNQTNVTIGEGDTLQLIAVITPDNASNKTVSWSSSSDTIASVNSTGLIKAKTPGQTTITVTANDGSGITATCNITVEKLVTNINELKAGDSVYYEDGQGAKQLCAVLYDSTSEYGVEIITMGTVENITLGSEDFNASMNSYNNAITTLNNATSRYLNPTYADKIRCVGSLPNNPSYDGEKMFVSSYDYMSKYNGYFKGEDNNYITDWNQMEKLGIRDINKFYWLASRYTVDGEANSWVRCTKC